MDGSNDMSSSDELNSNEMDSDDMPASDSEYGTDLSSFSGTEALDFALRIQLDARGRVSLRENVEYTCSYKHYTHFQWFADVLSDTMSSEPRSNPDDSEDDSEDSNSHLGSDMMTAGSDSRLDSDARNASIRYEFVTGAYDVYQDGKTVREQCAQRVTEYVNGKITYLGYFVDAKPAGAWYTWDNTGRATMHT